MASYRSIGFCLIFCLLNLLGVGSLWAQDAPVEEVPVEEAPVEEAPAEEAPVEEAPAEQAEQDDSEGWALFQRALGDLVDGELDSARNALEELAAAYPEHRATALSAEALGALRARAKQDLKQDAQQEKARSAANKIAPSGEAATAAARAELVAFQTAHGIALGAEFCAAVDCGDVRTTVAMLAVGGGAGLGLSLLASTEGVTPGFATLINSGTLWGAYHGAMINGAVSTGDSLAGALAVSQLVGIGAGALVWSQLHPTVGEVSMANSGGIWLGTLAFFGQLAIQDDIVTSNDAILWSILGLTDLGIVAGALLSQHEPMTRGRTLVIDSGGVLGLLTGIGTYVLINPDFDEPTGFALSAMAGTVAGLGAATYLTRNWDAPDDAGITARWGIAPSEEGATLSLFGEF